MAKWIEVDARVEIWRKEEGGVLLEGADWVIGHSQVDGSMKNVTDSLDSDAIDNIQTKVDLLKYCTDNSIKVIRASLRARVQISHSNMLTGVCIHGCWCQV